MPLSRIPVQLIDSELLTKVTTDDTNIGFVNKDGTIDYIPLPRNRNKIVNGDFNIWQRGTENIDFENTALRYTADRWYVDHGHFNNIGLSVERSTIVPTEVESGYYSQYSLKVSCSQAVPSLDPRNYALIGHDLEGHETKSLLGRTFTLSFWVNTNKPGTYAVLFKSGVDNLTAAVSNRFEFTVHNADTWEKKSIVITFDHALDTGWNYDHNTGLQVYFVLVAGLDYQSDILDTWLTQEKYSSSNQVNFADNTNNVFFISQVMMEEGRETRVFRPAGRFEEELNICKRYYQKSYDLILKPGTPNTQNCCGIIYGSKIDNSLITGFTFPVAMRDHPTVTIYHPRNGTAGAVASWGSGDTSEFTVLSLELGENNIGNLLMGSSLAAYDFYEYHYVAVAEMS